MATKQNEVDLFRDCLIQRAYPDNLIPIECVWVSQQTPGTATHIMDCVAIIEEHLNERRKE